MQTAAIIIFIMAIGINVYALARKIKIIREERQILITPSFRLFLLRLFGGSQDANRFERKITAIQRANSNTIKIDPTIFNRDIEEMLDAEVKRIQAEETRKRHEEDDSIFLTKKELRKRAPNYFTDRYYSVDRYGNRYQYDSYQKYNTYYATFGDTYLEDAERLGVMFSGTDRQITNEMWNQLTLRQQSAWLQGPRAFEKEYKKSIGSNPAG